MIDIVLYRSTIGLFNARRHLCQTFCFNYTNYFFRLLYIHISNIMHLLLLLLAKITKTAQLTYCNSFFLATVQCCLFQQVEFAESVLSYYFAALLYLYYIFCPNRMLLLLSGDVEVNPGPSQNSSLSILHQNIRSIRFKIDYICNNFVDFDILCFTETKLCCQIENESIFIDGYNVPYRKDNTSNSGGLLIYVASHLHSNQLNDFNTLLPESIWIQIRDQTKHYLICNVYRKPNSAVEFWERLNVSIEKAFEISKNIILVGDINEDQLNPNNHKLKDILFLNDMSNVINTPTRVCPTSNTLLDPIAIASSIHCCNSGIFQTDKQISDHFATYAFFRADLPQNMQYKRLVWNYKRSDFELLNHKISNTDWSFLHNGNINDSVNQFTEKFLDLAKSCIPTYLATIRPKDKPWFNSELRRMSRKRDRQKHIALKTSKVVDWNHYRALRNRVNNMKKHAKELFFNNLEYNLNDMKYNNLRQYWKTIRLLINNKPDNSTIPSLITETNTFVFSDVDKANVLNDYFASVSSVDDSQATLPEFTLRTDQSLNEINILEQDVIDVLENLVINKAAGPDGISHKLLKETAKSISKPLTILFNKSIHSETYPSLWKKANVIPLFKKGDKSVPSNYRPVSLISCVGKVMERTVFKYIFNYLHANKLIFKNQSGFISGHSTVYQLIDIYNQMCKGFDEHKSTCLVFCDISKAFDRVWHKGLIFKLSQHGFSHSITNWISSYLSLRTQKVCVGGSFSQEKHIKAGVPQGSVLGPLLFLLYINDISDSLSSTTRLFADDSSLAVSSDNNNIIEDTLNNDLNLLSNWAEKWLVKFNPLKTEVMYCSLSKQIRNLPTLFFQDTQLGFTDNHKHLGVTFSNDGSWHTHIANISNSASKILGSMRFLKFKLKRKTLNQMYVSYLRPILEYASIVWDNCTLWEQNKLERIQYDAARIVTGLTRSTSTDNLVKEMGWVSLSKRRLFQKLILMYKYNNNQLPSYLNDIYPSNVSETTGYNLRNSLDYATVTRRLEIYSRSVIPSSISAWNNLDINIRNSPTLSSFKYKLNQLFKPQQVPDYYFYGERYLQIHHARIRNRCSNLNADLCYNHLKDSSRCACGYLTEDAEHFFFRCPRYNEARINLFTQTRLYHPLNVHKLLFGLPELSYESNIHVFKAVHTFIKDSKRFA